MRSLDLLFIASLISTSVLTVYTVTAAASASIESDVKVMMQYQQSLLLMPTRVELEQAARCATFETEDQCDSRVYDNGDIDADCNAAECFSVSGGAK
jgi:hypothetical protein